MDAGHGARDAAAVDAFWGRGRIERDGACVGAWYVETPEEDVDGPYVSVLAAARTRDGRLAGIMLRAVPGSDAEPVVMAAVTALEEQKAEEATESASRFGFLLTYLLRARDQGADVTDAGWMVEAALGEGTEVRQPARDAATAAVRERAAHVGAFLDTLHPKALDVHLMHGRGRGGTHQSHMESALGGVWDMFDPTRDPDVPLARALSEAPRLAWCMVSEAAADPAAFRADVAAGRFAEVVARHCRRVHAMPRRWAEAVHRLDAAVHEDHVASDWLWANHDGLSAKDDVDPVVDLARSVAHLPSAWVPSGDAEWAAFASVVPLADWCGFVSGEDPDRAARLLNAGRGWAEFAVRMRATCGDRPFAKALRDTSDPVESLVRQLLQPAWAIASGAPAHVTAGFRDSIDFRGARALLVSGRSVRRVIEDSDAWHRRAHAIAEGIARLPAPLGDAEAWGAGLPDHRAGDAAVVVLTTDRELADEGAQGPDAHGRDGLDHCVGGYSTDCRKGTYRVASVRRIRGDGSWFRSSTIGLRTSRDGRVTLDQHSGRANATPSDEDAVLVDAYLGALSTGRLRVDAAALEPVAGGVTVARVAGYDWTVPGSWETVRDLWRPHLPRALHGATPEGIMRLVAESRTERDVTRTARARAADAPAGWTAPLPGMAA